MDFKKKTSKTLSADNRAPKNINCVCLRQAQREAVERNTYFREICDCGFC